MFLPSSIAEKYKKRHTDEGSCFFSHPVVAHSKIRNLMTTLLGEMQPQEREWKKAFISGPPGACTSL
jgi:hypothetical protein